MLSPASEVFKTMFKSAQTPMTAGSAKDNPLVVTDVAIFAFNTMLRYIYTDNLDELDMPNLFSVFYAAKKYEVISLVLRCFDQIDKRAIQIFQSIPFLSINQQLLCDLLKRDQLMINDEIEIWEAALRWADNQCHKNGKEITGANRREMLGPALFNIRFPAILHEDFSRNIGYNRSRKLLATFSILSLNGELKCNRQQTTVFDTITSGDYGFYSFISIAELMNLDNGLYEKASDNVTLVIEITSDDDNWLLLCYQSNLITANSKIGRRFVIKKSHSWQRDFTECAEVMKGNVWHGLIIAKDDYGTFRIVWSNGIDQFLDIELINETKSTQKSCSKNCIFDPTAWIDEQFGTEFMKIAFPVAKVSKFVLHIWATPYRIACSKYAKPMEMFEKDPPPSYEHRRFDGCMKVPTTKCHDFNRLHTLPFSLEKIFDLEKTLTIFVIEFGEDEQQSAIREKADVQKMNEKNDGVGTVFNDIALQMINGTMAKLLHFVPPSSHYKMPVFFQIEDPEFSKLITSDHWLRPSENDPKMWRKSEMCDTYGKDCYRVKGLLKKLEALIGCKRQKRAYSSDQMKPLANEGFDCYKLKPSETLLCDCDIVCDKNELQQRLDERKERCGIGADEIVVCLLGATTIADRQLRTGQLRTTIADDNCGPDICGRQLRATIADRTFADDNCGRQLRTVHLRTTIADDNCGLYTCGRQLRTTIADCTFADRTFAKKLTGRVGLVSTN
ncbi:hypothetical protein niasHS_015738 [Heterodera schachtii]|uniref:BTB domain-containing protein n=1 Tax=Heterodera schachtii TaxID=97005 RepID=A0ABD2HYR5_HETSC